MTFVSRILGFIRDMVIAHVFGADAYVDAFLVAFKLPNFMRRLFAEGAFSQAFIPVLSEVQTTKSADETRHFIGQVAGTLGGILLAITVLAILISPLLIMLSAPGFSDDPIRFGLTSDMLRITFPYLLFISLTALCGAVLNCFGYFAAPAFTPVLLNLSLLTAALWVAPQFDVPIKALAFGVLIAGVLQFLFQWPFLWRAGLGFKPRFAWRDPEVQRVVRLMVPALFGVSVAQINLYMDTLFATFLQAGSVSWLYFSLQLVNFPLGVFGVAIATVITPKLSRQVAEHNAKGYQKTIDWGIRMVLLLALPAAIGLLVLAKPLLITLFQYGRFDAFDVNMAALSLKAFALGLPGFMLVKVFTAGFYARQDIKTPVKIATFATLMNFILNLALIYPLAHLGLALSTTLASFANACGLFYLLRKSDLYQTQITWLKFLGQIVFANGLMIFILYLNHCDTTLWLHWRWSTRAEYLGLSIICAMLCYSLGLIITGFRVADIKLD